MDVYAEKGSGIDTPVGLSLDDLSVGQVLDDSNELFFRDGDINQEDLTNDAVGVWARHALLPLQPHRQPRRRPLLAPGRSGGPRRLLADLRRPRSHC